MKTMKTRIRTQTVELICIVEDPVMPSYLINGVRQRAGDCCRLQLTDALALVHQGKARIVKGSEKVEAA